MGCSSKSHQGVAELERFQKMLKTQICAGLGGLWGEIGVQNSSRDIISLSTHRMLLNFEYKLRLWWRTKVNYAHQNLRTISLSGVQDVSIVRFSAIISIRNADDVLSSCWVDCHFMHTTSEQTDFRETKVTYRSASYIYCTVNIRALNIIFPK